MEFTYVDTSDPKNVERALRKNTRIVYIETPTNPLMSLSDIEAISHICRRKRVELVVDNTFMSPYFQQPIALGADMVVHSTTKFLMDIATAWAALWFARPRNRLRSWLSCRKPQERFSLLSSAGWFCEG